MTAKKTTKKATTTKKTTKKFNPKTATKADFNRKLKAVASRKCRAKDEAARKAAEAEYAELVAIKNERFHARKTYQTMTAEEIAALDLETTVKAIKSLQSLRCTAPNKADHYRAIEAKFQKHRTQLVAQAEIARLEKLLK